MYTFDAIILEKNYIREKHLRLVVLSEEYGKITLWYKKQLTGVDIGDIARVVVSHEKNINTLKNISPKYHLLHKKWQYENLIAFLEILKILKNCIADADVTPNIFRDYKKTLQIMGDTISTDHCSLLKMRIFKYLGSLNPDFFESDSVLKYMYHNISLSPLERILKSQPLKANHKNIIENSNLFAFSAFI